jgi:hypothetical protein
MPAELQSGDAVREVGKKSRFEVLATPLSCSASVQRDEIGQAIPASRPHGLARQHAENRCYAALPYGNRRGFRAGHKRRCSSGAKSGAAAARNELQRWSRNDATPCENRGLRQFLRLSARGCASGKPLCVLASGEDRIRTCGPGYPGHRFSKPALSTTQPPLPRLARPHSGDTDSPWRVRPAIFYPMRGIVQADRLASISSWSSRRSPRLPLPPITPPPYPNTDPGPSRPASSSAPFRGASRCGGRGNVCARLFAGLCKTPYCSFP